MTRGRNRIPLRPVQDWMLEGNPCSTTDPDLWHAKEKDVASTRKAKWLCATACANTQICLDYALEHNEQFGVWGSASPRDRLKLRRAVADGEAA